MACFSSPTINLNINYRSTQNILDAAGSVIDKVNKNDLLEDHALKAKNSQSDKKISVYDFSSPDYEIEFVAGDIEKKIKSGEAMPDEIAILYRDNKDVLPVIDVLSAMEIPFIIESDQNILEDDEIRKIILLLKTINSFGDDVLLAKTLHIDFLGLEMLDVHTLIKYARSKNKSLYSCLKNIEKLEDININKKEKFISLYKKLSKWKIISLNKHYREVIDTIISESGYINNILSQEGTPERIYDLESLYGGIFVGEKYYLGDFLDYIDLLYRYNLSLKRKIGAELVESVHLLTAHRSKGLEFSHVYIIGVENGHWGNRKTIEHFRFNEERNRDNELNDERRLFYVSLTRAKKSVIITHSRSGRDGVLKLPSSFILEIDEQYINWRDTKEIEQEIKKNRKTRLAGNKHRKTKINEKEYYKKLFTEQGLSATALNNYLSCPWRYFYRNLIKIPEAKTTPLLFGMAIHGGLRRYFDKFQKDGDPGANYLMKSFKDSLNDIPLKTEEKNNLKKRGEGALLGFLKNKKPHRGAVLNEFYIRGVHLENEIKLSGVIDKIEFTDGGGFVNVVDYKTGKPKTRNNILGKTKDSNGDYYRQLVFYKLILELFDNERFSVGSGEISFIEADKKGVWKNESFNISDKEVVELEKTIKVVAEEILSLKFWNKYCDNKKCEHCKLRKLSLK